MSGAEQPPRAARQLPEIDPNLVSACRAANPYFGQRKRSSRLAQSGRWWGGIDAPDYPGADQPAYRRRGSPDYPDDPPRYRRNRPADDGQLGPPTNGSPYGQSEARPPAQRDASADVESQRPSPGSARVTPQLAPQQTPELTPQGAPPSAPARAADSAPAIEAPSTAPAAPLANEAAPSNAGKRPNIVFILTDDLSMDLVQFMPHVVKMQKEGVTFANYFATDSLCCPSRASIFTGRYPHSTGVYRNVGDDGGYTAFTNRGLEHSTFATALSANSYHTAMLGKYLNRYWPDRNPVAPGWTLWSVAGNGYREFNYGLNQNGKLVNYGRDPKDYLTDVISAQAAQFIRQQGNTPFVIEVATFAPHRPFIPAPRDAAAFPDLRAPRSPAYNAAPDDNAVRWLRVLPPIAGKEMDKIDRYYRMRAQSVQAVDKMIGDLQAAVAAIGQQSNTYFVFSSDNGFHMGEHRLLPGKQTAFDTDIHIPLVITGPGVAPATTIKEITQNIDLCPTFIELGGGAIPANVDGRSLVPLMHGEKISDWRTLAVIEHHGPMLRIPDDPDAMDFDDGDNRWSGRGHQKQNRHYGFRNGNPPTYEAIRSPSWIYVEYAGGDKEYHDLATDPNELRNTYPSLSGEQKAALRAKIEAVKNCQGSKSCAAAERAPDVTAQK
jgi:N-acetylglucosamine-6-sulfatase